MLENDFKEISLQMWMFGKLLRNSIIAGEDGVEMQFILEKAASVKESGLPSNLLDKR